MTSRLWAPFDGYTDENQDTKDYRLFIKHTGIYNEREHNNALDAGWLLYDMVRPKEAHPKREHASKEAEACKQRVL